MKSLVEMNRFAVQVVAFFVSPIGILIMLSLVQIIEGMGIAIFFSELTHQKAGNYINDIKSVNANWDVEQLLQVVSFGVGIFLSLTTIASVLILRLQGKNGIASLFAMLFAILSFATYYNVLDVKLSWDLFRDMQLLMRTVGILSIVTMSSVLASQLSYKLAEFVGSSEVFHELNTAINDRLKEGWNEEDNGSSSYAQVPRTRAQHSTRISNLS